MTLSVQIADDELLRLAVITGDMDPADLQGLLSKLRQADEDNKTAHEDGYADFLAHDHSGAGKGRKLGATLPEGGGRADSFESGTFTNAKFADLSVRAQDIAAGAVGSAAIGDNQVTAAKIGAATKSAAFSVNKDGTTSVTHGLGRYPIFHVECAAQDTALINLASYIITVDVTTTTFTFKLHADCTIDNVDGVRVVYR